MRRWIRFGVVGVLLAPYALALAQEISTIDLVSGNYGKYATTLKLAELPDGYKAVRLAIGETDPISGLMPFFLLSGGGHGDTKTAAQYKISACYWSNGDVVRSMGHDFLVTYKLDWNMEAMMLRDNPMDVSGTASAPPREPALKINLVALNSIQKVEPCPDITKKDLLDAFGGGPKPGVGSLKTQTISNAKQVGLGMLMYTNDYDDYYPYAQSSKAAWYVEYPYVKNINVFKTLNPNGGSFRFNMGIAGAVSSSIPEPANTVMLYESEAWPDGSRVVGFVDGHVKSVPKELWEEMAKHLTPAGIKRAKKPLPAKYESEFDKIPAKTNPPPR